MSHETHAKDCNFNTLKTVEALILLDVIATWIMKSYNTNQGKINTHMNSRDAWRRIESTTKVSNYFNPDSEAEKINKKNDERSRSTRGAEKWTGSQRSKTNFPENPGPMLIKIYDEETKKFEWKQPIRKIVTLWGVIEIRSPWKKVRQNHWQ